MIEKSPPSRKEQLFEVSAFLFLILPSLIMSFFIIKQGKMGFVLLSLSVILRDLSLLLLIFFFIWRNAEPLSAIGWTRRYFWREAGAGIWLYIPVIVIATLIESMLVKAGLSGPPSSLPALTEEKGIAQFILGFFLVLVVAIVEETIFRGYLMLRIRAVTRSPVIAVLVSAITFSLGHGYEGTASVVTIGFMGAFLAIIYLWRESLVAPIVIHFLQDFIGIVLLPLLKELKHIY